MQATGARQAFQHEATNPIPAKHTMVGTVTLCNLHINSLLTLTWWHRHHGMEVAGVPSPAGRTTVSGVLPFAVAGAIADTAWLAGARPAGPSPAGRWFRPQQTGFELEPVL